MTHPTDDELDALVKLTEEFVTATWHLLDNSETSGPKDDPTIAVWQPNFDEVSALLDRCEGLPSGSMEHMAAGELLAANMTAAIAALRAQLAEAQADLTFMTEDRNKWQDSATDRYFRIEEANARADRAEAERAEQRVAALEAAPVTLADALKVPEVQVLVGSLRTLLIAADGESYADYLGAIETATAALRAIREGEA